LLSVIQGLGEHTVRNNPYHTRVESYQIRPCRNWKVKGKASISNKGEEGRKKNETR